jgi:hypothetical protein
MHGAGTKKRPGGRGTPQKPGGRPPTHGLYSKRVVKSLEEALEEYRSDPKVTQALEHLAHFAALRDRAEQLLMQAEREMQDLADAGKLKGRARNGMLAKLMTLQSHVGLLADKGSLAQDRWHKQTHGEKFSWIDLPVVEIILKKADECLERFVDPGALESARNFLSDSLAQVAVPGA